MLDPRSRRLGDMLADTVVVYEINFNLKEPDFTTCLNSGTIKTPALELQRKLNEAELYVIRRFLNDRYQLSPDRQQVVGQKLAASVKKRLQLTTSNQDPILFLETVYREHANEDKK